MDSAGYPLAGLCDQWRTLFEAAAKQGWEEFHQYAHKCYQFFDGPPTYMWDESTMYGLDGKSGYLNRDQGVRLPMFKGSINKISDAVDLYGPSLMHQYPQVTVSATYPTEVSPEALGLDIQDPRQAMEFLQISGMRDAEMKVRDTTAAISQDCLSWFQIAAHKKDQARLVITDAIVSGVGVGYTKLYQPRGTGIRFPMTEFIPSQRLLKDPDADTHRDVEWIAIECIEPVNRVEEEHNLPPGTLKGNMQSAESKSTRKGLQDAKNSRKKSESWDLLRYWKLFSKNGAGTRLKTANKLPPEIKQLLDSFGDYVFLAIAENVPYPLNLPTEFLMSAPLEQIQQAVSWPTPFYTDQGSGKDWPITELYFKENPRKKWPPSLFKHLIPLIEFVNWCFSFMADKVATSATEYLGVLKTASENIQEQLRDQRGPFQFIELDSTMGRKIEELITFLGKPNFDMALWEMVEKAIAEIERGSGVTEIMYGMQSRAMRSAKEAMVVEGNSTIRVDDMAEKTDDWYSVCNEKEWQVAVWHLTGQDVVPVIGQAAAQVFEQSIITQPFDSWSRNYSYRVVADSARKPDRHARKQELSEFGQVASPIMLQLASSGVMGPFNAYVTEWAKAVRLTDYERFTVPDETVQAAMATVAQAQAAAQGPQQGNQSPSPEDEAAQRQAQFEQQMAMDAAKGEQQLAIEGQKSQLKLATDAQLALQKIQAAAYQQGQQIDAAKMQAAQGLAQTEAQARIALAQKAMLPSGK